MSVVGCWLLNDSCFAQVMSEEYAEGIFFPLGQTTATTTTTGISAPVLFDDKVKCIWGVVLLTGST